MIIHARHAGKVASMDNVGGLRPVGCFVELFDILVGLHEG